MTDPSPLEERLSDSASGAYPDLPPQQALAEFHVDLVEEVVRRLFLKDPFDWLAYLLSRAIDIITFPLFLLVPITTILGTVVDLLTFGAFGAGLRLIVRGELGLLRFLARWWYEHRLLRPFLLPFGILVVIPAHLTIALSPIASIDRSITSFAESKMAKRRLLVLVDAWPLTNAIEDEANAVLAGIEPFARSRTVG